MNTFDIIIYITYLYISAYKSLYLPDKNLPFYFHSHKYSIQINEAFEIINRIGSGLWIETYSVHIYRHPIAYFLKKLFICRMDHRSCDICSGTKLCSISISNSFAFQEKNNCQNVWLFGVNNWNQTFRMQSGPMSALVVAFRK